MALLVLPALLCNAAPARAPYPGKYTLESGWPAELAKISPMNGTSGVDVDAVAGEVYVCQQRGSPRITVWDSKSGALKRSWGDDTLDTPHGIRVKRARTAGAAVEIWAADMGVGVAAGHPPGHKLAGFTPDGKLLHTVGQPGVPGTGLNPLQFGNVADVDWDPQQDTMVAVDGDGGPNNRAVAIKTAGFGVETSWGGLGGPSTHGKFNISHGVAIDECSRVWVADRANARVQIFDIKGEWLASWSCFGVPPYGVRHFPAKGSTGRVLVTGGGAPPAWPSGVNKMSILEYNTDCSTPADLGECSVSYAIEADPKSTAHFAAIDMATEDIYLAEVTLNKLYKYTYSPA